MACPISGRRTGTIRLKKKPEQKTEQSVALSLNTGEETIPLNVSLNTAPELADETVPQTLAEEVQGQDDGAKDSIETEALQEKPESDEWKRCLPSIRKDNKDYPGTLPPPPLEKFSLLFRKFVEGIANGVNVPVEMAFGCLLAFTGNLLGRTRKIQYTIKWREYANLFMMIIGDTGMGKSPLLDAIYEPLMKWEDELADKYIEEMDKYKKEYEKWVRASKTGKCDAPPPLKPIQTQYIADDVTPEAIVQGLDENPRGMQIVKDELRAFFKEYGNYTNNNQNAKDKLLSMWSSKRVKVSRKNHNNENRGLKVPEACIGIYGNIQPENAKDLFTAEDNTQGWPQRFLYVRARRTKIKAVSEKSFPSWIDDKITQLTDHLLLIGLRVVDSVKRPQPVEVRLNGEARRLVEKKINELTFWSNGVNELNRYCKKMCSTFLRLILIIEFLEWGIEDIRYTSSGQAIEEPEPYEISVETVKKAIATCDWFLLQAKAAMRLLFPPKEGRPETTTDELFVTKTILAHEREIENEMVHMSQWYSWFPKRDDPSKDYYLLLKSYMGIAKELGVKCQGDYCVIPKKTLALCRAIVRPERSWFEEYEGYEVIDGRVIYDSSPEWEEAQESGEQEVPNVKPKPARRINVQQADTEARIISFNDFPVCGMPEILNIVPKPVRRGKKRLLNEVDYPASDEEYLSQVV